MVVNLIIVIIVIIILFLGVVSGFSIFLVFLVGILVGILSLVNNEFVFWDKVIKVVDYFKYVLLVEIEGVFILLDDKIMML